MSKALKAVGSKKDKLKLKKILYRKLFDMFQSLEDRIADKEIVTSINCHLNPKSGPSYMTVTLLSLSLNSQNEPIFSNGRLHLMWDNNGQIYKAERT